LLDQGSPNPLYQRWIDTYGGEEFADIVRAVLALADRLGEGLSGEEEARVTEHFVTTARTSGCSGTWATARNSADLRSRPINRRPGHSHRRAGKPDLSPPPD
jgi:hypothetical protein